MGKTCYTISMKFKKRSALLLLFAVAVCFLTACILFQISKSRTFQLFGTLIPRVETDKKVVALTLDDAPTEYTESVLKTLKQKDVPATFFVIGSLLEKHPELGKKIVSEGHQIGNHSYSHKRFLLKSQSYIDKEIQTTNTLIRQTGYESEIFFRPPNGKKLIGLPWYLSQHNIRTIMWDVEPDTYVPSNLQGTARTDYIVHFAIEHTTPGSIILLHPFCQSCDSDREAIGDIIDGLKAEGYTFVTVSQLLSHEKQ